VGAGSPEDVAELLAGGRARGVRAVQAVEIDLAEVDLGREGLAVQILDQVRRRLVQVLLERSDPASQNAPIGSQQKSFQAVPGQRELQGKTVADPAESWGAPQASGHLPHGRVVVALKGHRQPGTHGPQHPRGLLHGHLEVGQGLGAFTPLFLKLSCPGVQSGPQQGLGLWQVAQGPLQVLQGG